MKKSLILACLLFASTSVFAQYQADAKTQKGGFDGPSSAATTIEKAKKLRDDTNVILEGNIVQHLWKDKYLFKDSSGEITVEIDDDDWNGVVVTSKDVVILYGEVDKDWNSVEIDVDKIVKK
jgi:uncharacterized protein (TIGR00156 family)